MRYSKILASLGACAIALSALAGGIARADDEFDVAINGGSVTVTSKGAWHVNKNYPWKLTAGSTKLDKGKFSFTETSAMLEGAPKGPATLRGGICSGDRCKNFEKVITIP